MFHSKMVIVIIGNQYWSAGLKFIDLPKKKLLARKRNFILFLKIFFNQDKKNPVFKYWSNIWPKK